MMRAMSDAPVFSLSENPVHLGLGATIVRQPRFTGDSGRTEPQGQEPITQ